MSRLSVEDESILSKVHPTSGITCLDMLKMRTINSLTKQGVLTVHDLVQQSSVALMTILDIDPDERELLLDITQQLLLFNCAYDNLHG